MSRELIKKLRNYADIAEVADKPHWADAMRKAAEYIKSDIEKPFPEPVAGVAILDGKPALVKIGKEDSYEGRLYAEPQARKPLSDGEIDLACGYRNNDCRNAFRRGVRFAEKHNGIKGQE